MRLQGISENTQIEGKLTWINCLDEVNVVLEAVKLQDDSPTGEYTVALTNEEASIILGMIARHDNHHDIAAWFGVNQGRIDDVKKGEYGVGVAAPEKLPPKGPPGIKGRRLTAFVEKAVAALDSGDVDGAKAALLAGLERFNRHEA